MKRSIDINLRYIGISTLCILFRKIGFLLLICFVGFSLDAQKTSIDSLKQRLPNSDDTARVNLLNQLAAKLTRKDQPAAGRYAAEALRLADSINYDLGKAEAHRLLGYFYNIEEAVFSDEGSYQFALTNLLKALDIFKKEEAKNGEALTLGHLGKLHYDHGQYDRAYEYLLSAIKLFEQLGNKKQLADCYNRLGNVFYQQENFEKACEYYSEAFNLQENVNDSFGMSQSLNNLGSVMYEMDSLTKGLDFHMQSLNLKIELEDLMGASISYNNIGDIYEKMGDLDQAISYQNEALDLAFQIGNVINRIYTYNRLASAFLKKGDLESAEDFLLKSKELVEKSEYSKLQMDTYWLLHQLYEIQEAHQLSLKYFKNYATMKDSIFSNQRANLIADLRVKYETERSEMENNLLKEKETILQAKLASQLNTVIIVIVALVLALGLILALLRINKVRKKANKRLSKAYSDLKKTQSQLVQSEKMASLGQVTAGVAHEINNPLSFISTSVFVLEKHLTDMEKIVRKCTENGSLTEESKTIILELQEEMAFEEMLKEIPEISAGVNEGIDRISRIVKSLRLFSSGGVGTRAIVNMHDHLDSALVMLESRTRGHIDIIRDYADDPPEVLCYPGQISQVFVNVLNNAIDAIGEEEGSIRLQTKSVGGYAQVDIDDNGMGMNEETRQKIFDPFFSTKEVGQPGLGLSISLGIIQRHNGKIEVKSEPGMGTKVCITLPIGSEKAER